MEQEINRESTSINDFDFMSKRSSDKPVKTKIDYQKFLNVSKNSMIAIGISLAVGATAIGGYNIYQSNMDSKIAAAEGILKNASAPKIIEFIGKEKIANEKTYITNQLLINQYGTLKDVVEVLNKQQEVANFQSKNTKLYDSITKALNADIVAVDTLFKAPTKTREEKITAYIDNANIGAVKKWQDAIVTNQFVHIGNMMDLNKQIKNSLANIEQVKKDILEQVQSRIKNGDFDLNAAQTEFSKNVVGQTQAQISELNQAKKDLNELKNQSVENADGSITKADPNTQNIITDKDLNEAGEALNIYQNQAINQISGDREKVEQLIAQAKQQQIPSNVSNNAHNPNVVVVNNGPSFLDYYLMYSWMNSGSRNTVTHTTVNYPSEHSNYKAQSRQNNNINTSNYKPVNIPKPKMYDLNNNNSYLNKQLERSPILNNNKFGKSSDAIKKFKQYEKTKVSITEIRAKIAESKVKVEQAKGVRAREIKRIETAKTNKYEKEVEKSNRQNKSSSSWNKTNKSTSNYGSSGRSFGSSKKR